MPLNGRLVIWACMHLPSRGEKNNQSHVLLPVEKIAEVALEQRCYEATSTDLPIHPLWIWQVDDV